MSSSNNLPQQLTSFIGRERETAEVKSLLGTTRLLTLTGVGGCGKTRLSVQIAARILDEYPDGVWFVELAGLRDPHLVPSAVASVLGVHEEDVLPVARTISDYLQPLKLLLLLDNCEHLVSACASLADALLRSCPRLTILATSREALHVTGEVVWSVPPLSVPDPRRRLPMESLLQYEALQLFVERARSSRPDFGITPENAPSVAQLCYRSDGIPLAIELAAARVNVLTVQQIVERLDQRFRLLISGSRTTFPRHQTLKALLDWSYDLLSEPEQALMRALSVFAGGSALPAVKAVCGGELDEYEVIELLSCLVRKSLVIMEEYGAEARYRLLDTIRQYAFDKLLTSGESRPIHNRHRDWYLALAEQAQAGLLGDEQGVWLDRLETEHDNLRAAIQWSTKGESNAEAALRLCSAMWRFWDTRGYLTEGMRSLNEALEIGDDAPLPVRAKALNAAGNLAFEQGDYERAMALYNEALALRRETGDRRGTAGSLTNLGVVARSKGDYGWAARLYRESLDLFRELGNDQGVASVLVNLGFVMQCQGDYEQAKELYAEALALSQELGNKSKVAASLNNLGEVAWCQGNYQQAAALFNDSLGLAQELGDKMSVADVLNNLGNLANSQGDHKRAQQLYKKSLALCQEMGYKQGVTECLVGLATTDTHRRELAAWVRAATLFGAAETLRERIHANLPRYTRMRDGNKIAMARSCLGEEIFAEAWTAGQTMTPDQAIQLALEEPTQPMNGPHRKDLVNMSFPNGIKFTEREVDVLRLVRLGLTDAQIAGNLTLSTRTVQFHLQSVYRKLDVDTRGAATQHAIELGII